MGSVSSLSLLLYRPLPQLHYWALCNHKISQRGHVKVQNLILIYLMLSAHNSPLFGFLYHITFTLWFRLLLWYANHARQYLNWCSNVFICISSSIWLCGMCNTRDDSIKVNWAALTVNFILSEMSCGNLFQYNIVKLGKFLRDSGYETHSVRWEWIIVVYIRLEELKLLCTATSEYFVLLNRSSSCSPGLY